MIRNNITRLFFARGYKSVKNPLFNSIGNPVIQHNYELMKESLKKIPKNSGTEDIDGAAAFIESIFKEAEERKLTQPGQ